MSFLSRWFTPPYEPPETPPEPRNISISDPAAFELFGAMPSLTGVNVNEISALGVSAVWCAVTLIASNVAKLPLCAVSNEGGVTKQVPSWLDNPGLNLTKFELIQTTVGHLLLHGNAYLAHVYGGAGQLLGVQPFHPLAVTVDVDKTGAKTYRVSLIDGTSRMFDDSTLTHIKDFSLDGIRGLSPLAIARNGMFGTTIAADRSAAKLFGNGALMSALATVEEQLPEDEAKTIVDGLRRRASGVSNAGEIAFINRNIKFQPWSVSNADAQWLESRTFQVEEIARWYGIPATLMGLNEKQTSFGAGIKSMHQAMVSFTLTRWTCPIQERLSLLLPTGTSAVFDYHDMLTPDPEANVNLLIAQVEAGLMTPNEARQALNRTPMVGGDVLRPPQAPQPPTEAAA